MKFQRVLLLIVLGAALAVAGFFFRTHHGPAGQTSVPPAAGLKPTPPEVAGPFYAGVSSLDVEANERAGRLFEELAKKLPDEPAVWVNLGIARLRLGDSPGAAEALLAAEKLSPGNTTVNLLQATLDEDQGQFASAIARLQKVPAPEPAVLYRLSQLLSRTGNAADLPRQREILDQLRLRQPANPVILLDRARLLARLEDKSALLEAIAGLNAIQGEAGPSAPRQLAAAKAAAEAGNFRAAAAELTFLQNSAQAAPAYQAGLAALDAAGGSVGRPIRELIRYAAPAVVVPEPDLGLRFAETVDSASPARPELYLTADLSDKAGGTALALGEGSLRVGPATTLAVAASAQRGRNSICVADLDGDFLPDLAVAGEDGVKIWRQDEAGHFSAGEPAGEVRAAFAPPAHGVWAFDYDADGDLDLLVARNGQAPQLFRNNGDGTFTASDTLAAFPEIEEACWADFDGDGDGDLAFRDAAGRLFVSWNERAGAFGAPQLVSDATVVALAFGDIEGAGHMDLVALDRNGLVSGLHFDREKKAWSTRELAHWTDASGLADALARRRVSLSVADLDNNGAIDVVASADATTAIWLNAGSGKFQRLPAGPSLFVTSIADVDGDGLLDLVGVSDQGAAVARGHGTKGYHWQSIRTRTLGAHGDSRINTFGLGGRIEIRAGPLTAMAPITSPRTHFGLGDHPQVDLARIVWPNGVAQVEFAPPPDQETIATQRLKGSCPWVFTRDGNAFRFVKDFIWRSPLGMRINSQDTAGVDQTSDWILIPGKLLTADRGAYEVRVTAELWETHFFDHVSLKVVDHPDASAALIDERFVPTAQPKLEVIAASRPQPFAGVRDQAGRDVAAVLAGADGDCVNDFPLGRFQGIAPDHWIDFQLPDSAPADQPLLLVATGWIYPTDSSLNVALSQGSNGVPHGLALESFDPELGWRPVGGDLGFPAGKNKTVVIPLPREPVQAGHRRFRLRTNLEIYWDQAGWAVAQPATEFKVTPVETLAADLRHRGFSRLESPQRQRMDVPLHYETLSGPGPRWRDLEGYYTRYGDIRELLGQVDDRYVIMNAGDEMVFRFAAPPPPPAGWTRDFVLVGDGWVKDGDFNTANSRTVEPLPAHALRHYGGPPRPLEDDPVFQQHRDDWQRFHTRYVAPTAFDRGLMVGVSEPEQNAAR